MFDSFGEGGSRQSVTFGFKSKFQDHQKVSVSRPQRFHGGQGTYKSYKYTFIVGPDRVVLYR